LQILTILSRGKIQTQDIECQLKPTIQRYIICSVRPLYAMVFRPLELRTKTAWICQNHHTSNFFF